MKKQLELVKVERLASSVSITLNRANKKNALDEMLTKRLIECIELFDNDATIKSIVIKADGNDFCAGMDFAWVAECVSKGNDDFAVLISRLFEVLSACSKPIVTIAQGYICGGGVGILACSDIVLASPDAVIQFPEIKVGLLPAIISPYVLNMMSSRQARRYFLTAEAISADHALQLGLIHRIVSPEKINSTVEKIIENLSLAETSVLSDIKKISCVDVTDKKHAMIKMRQLLLKAAKTETAQRRISEFFSKCKKQVA